jgi:hypothetical protein
MLLPLGSKLLLLVAIFIDQCIPFSISGLLSSRETDIGKRSNMNHTKRSNMDPTKRSNMDPTNKPVMNPYPREEFL